MNLETIQHDYEDEFLRRQFEDNPRYEECPLWKETFFLLEEAHIDIWPKPFTGEALYEG